MVTRILAACTILRALYTANIGTRTMSFNNGAGPGVWVAVGAADGRSRWAFESSRSLQRLRLLSEEVQLETKRRNEGPGSERGERMSRVPLCLAG
jgi:hypothetical protein